jgi:hypothetical protein
MPRDVATQWNSTFDMLQFALKYKGAIRAIAGDVKLELTGYELSAVEWEIAKQLRNVLHVSVT